MSERVGLIRIDTEQARKLSITALGLVWNLKGTLRDPNPLCA